jgi:hypothetical protein
LTQRELLHHLIEGNTPVIGLRKSGFVDGYVWQDDTNNKPVCMKRRFMEAQLVDIDTPLLQAIAILVNHQFCFVTSMGQVTGFISRKWSIKHRLEFPGRLL